MPHSVTDEDIARHEGLVRRYARRLALHPDMIPDLEQEGRIAVFQALQRYDPTRGLTEGAYVGSYVWGAMRHFLRDQAHTIRYPAYLQERGVMPPALASLDAAALAGVPDSCGADYYQNTEAAALAEVTLDHALERAKLSRYQEQCLQASVSQPGRTPRLIMNNAHVARRKLRKAVTA